MCSRQLFSVVKDNLPKQNWKLIFHIKLSSFVCSSMDNASIIGSDLLGFNLGFYHRRMDFDSKGYATETLGLEMHPLTISYLEDIWEDCRNEEEVLQKDHTRLTLQQIKAFKLKFNVEGIMDDGLNLVEPGWKKLEKARFLVVDWFKEEEDDINRRIRFILTYMDDWLQQRARRSIREPPVEVTSSLEFFQSDISSPPVAGDTVIQTKKE